MPYVDVSFSLSLSPSLAPHKMAIKQCLFREMDAGKDLSLPPRVCCVMEAKMRKIVQLAQLIRYSCVGDKLLIS